MITLLAGVAAAQQVSFEAVTRVQVGQDPSLTVSAHAPGKLSVDVACGDRHFTWSGGVADGFTHRVALAGLPLGQTPCAGSARLDAPDGAWAETPLSFTVAVLPPIGWTVGDQDWDRERRHLVVHPDRPLKEVRAVAIGVGGQELEVAYADLGDPSAPSLDLGTTDEIVQIRVTGTDPDGFTSELLLSPWFYAIPHEDVVFASGSAEITAAEAPKLEKCWADVQRVVATYGSLVPIRLYVAGYTDTVGTEASNLELSRRRAKAIATWFRSRGFAGEVAWQGFGEEVLAVPTKDETDAPANRRAVYVLAAQDPPIGRDLPRSDWSR
ncbi:MAG: OmpA family protein [Alphaproteobacteria bacterium]|nr:OmpA family protein [Alphaproteobacteria bacterium]MCB9698432.1 OmpA family protein [Alphaproteobacteria bacterium]